MRLPIGVWPTIAMILAIVLAIGGTVCLFIFVLSKKASGKNKFMNFLRNFLEFRYLILEKALKALYIFCTAFVILYGFLIVWIAPGSGFILMLLGPIVLRLSFELSMMFVLLVKNTIEINGKLADQTPDETPADAFDVPLPFEKKAAPAEAAAPVEPVVVAEPEPVAEPVAEPVVQKAAPAPEAPKL